MRRLTIGICIAAGLIGCAPAAPREDMNSIAERYVKLVLKVGQHDKDFVDAYYGDPAWKPAGAALSLTELTGEAGLLRKHISEVRPGPSDDELVRLRRDYLEKQLTAVEARILMLSGQKFTFDEEAGRLYDAKPPTMTDADFQPVLDELGRLLPGRGPLLDRYEAFRKKYVIPTERSTPCFAPRSTAAGRKRSNI
jgi:hypothetical protein